jgi:tight adherence protein B
MNYLVAISVGLFVAVLFFAVVEVRKYRNSTDRLARLRIYSPRDQERHEERIGSGGLNGIFADLNRLLSKMRWAKGFAVRSENAGLKIQPLMWVFYILGGGLTLSIVFNSAVPFWPLAFALGFGVTLLASRLLIVSRENKRRSMFEQQLPEFLLLISSSLRSGLSLTQSLESVSQQGNGEVERQIRRATSEIAMGMTPNDALMEVALRMKSADMRWVNVAIAIQREVGGNLSVILDSVADTVRDRANIKREVETLSSESRLSAWVLLALPLVVFVFFYLFRRDYVEFFWTTLPGALMMLLFLALVTLGALWMRSLIRIKV